jgi:Domain of Unknown Function (DUF1206)
MISTNRSTPPGSGLFLDWNLHGQGCAGLQPEGRDRIDGALQKLAHASYGPYLLGITAAGLVCYGLFCSVDARYRDV